MKTILAPVDFSSVTAAVVREAAALARMVDGRVVLLNVVQLPAILSEYAGTIDIAEITAAGEKNAARQLEALKEELEDQFIETEIVQMTGSPVLVILEQAGSQGADYIVMGSHGHTAFYDLLVGSTTHGVLLRAKRPVLIVPMAGNAAKKLNERKRAVLV